MTEVPGKRRNYRTHTLVGCERAAGEDVESEDISGPCGHQDVTLKLEEWL